MISTTLNIHKDYFYILNFYSEKKNLSMKKIILICINEIIDTNNIDQVKNFSQISYQKRDPVKKNWHKFHVRLSGGEYEFLQDLRLSFKMSVSKIVAWAIDKYLSEGLKKKDKRDSYLLNNYIMVGHLLDDTQIFIRCWGFLNKFENILQIE